MKTLVVYSSHTGYTKKYAEWIAGDLKADILNLKEFTAELAGCYETIVYGGWLKAGKISGLGVLKRHLKDLGNKKFCDFCTGNMLGTREELEALVKKNFTKKESAKIKTFYFRGGFDYKKLSRINKFIMRSLKFVLQIKKNPTEGEKAIIESFYSPVDYTAKENIKELMDYLKNG